MQHPVKRKRRRGHKGQVPLQAQCANHVWTYDFVHDATQDGRKLRFLTLIDEYGRRALAVEPRRSFRGDDVLRVLEQAIGRFGAHAFLPSDNGSQLIAKAVKAWLAKAGIQTHYIHPGSPWQNAFGESFNGTSRREYLNRELFATLAEAQVLTPKWVRYYNTERIHTSLGNVPPRQYHEATQRDCPAGLGALPPTPRGLSPAADPQQRQEGGAKAAQAAALPHPCVFGPVAAPGSLPSVALSSGRAKKPYQFPLTTCSRNRNPGDSLIADGPKNGGLTIPTSGIIIL